MKRSRQEFRNISSDIRGGSIVDEAQRWSELTGRSSVVVLFSIVGLAVVALLAGSCDALVAGSPTVGAAFVTESSMYGYHRRPRQSDRWRIGFEYTEEEVRSGHHPYYHRNTQEAIDNNNGTPLPSENGSSDDEVCRPIEKCQQCTFSERKKYEACQATGRWEKFECVLAGGGADVGGDAVRNEMKSCKYTEADEEFAMVRLQMLCLLIGVIAVASVRRQKRLTANLFDQRKMPQQLQNSNSNGIGFGGDISTSVFPFIKPSKKRGSVAATDNDEEVEFTPMTNQQLVEMAPLMPSDGYGYGDDDLEVV